MIRNAENNSIQLIVKKITKKKKYFPLDINASKKNREWNT